MSLAWQKNLLFEQRFLQQFGERNGIKTQYVLDARLETYQKLLRQKARNPDLLEVDIVWTAMLADDLVDLTPYVQQKRFSPQIVASYTVGGRLVAVPLFIDVGVLYYRPDILRQYGFAAAPQTWEELEEMANRIQKGEQEAGKRDFWAFVWQGAVSEGLTCNALEWQSSAGGANFIDNGGNVNVRNPQLTATLQRALRWMGTISPPAEYAYWEEDAVNLWDAGNTAFMRNWASAYGHIAETAAANHQRFSVAPLPRGPGGHRGTLGGLGIGISKYSANRKMALQALLELTNDQNTLGRMLATGGIPAQPSVSQRPEVKARSSLLAISTELIEGSVARPSSVTGRNYDRASHEYALAINSVLRRKETPETAVIKLEKTLTEITGFPARRLTPLLSPE